MLTIETGGASPEAARTIETIEVRIGSVRIELEVRAPLGARLRLRYGAFTARRREGGSPPRLRLTTLVDDDPCEAGETPCVPSVQLDMQDESRVRLRGDCRAWLDVSSGRGVLEGGGAFTGMDALIRLSLSLLAPTDGWILFHGAGVELVSGDWALLLGSSGAGKSTAAKAFVSYCDESVLARSDGRGAEAASTPYWNGRPGRAPCRVVVCLERSEEPAARWLTGREAVRVLSRHVVRHMPREAVDRNLFEQLCVLVEKVPILLVRSRTGDGYPTSLAGVLGSFGFAPQWKSVEPVLPGDVPCP